MQIRRRAVLIYLIRPLPHVTVWWCVLCRILRGSFSLNVDEKGCYFSMQFKGQQIGMYDVVSTCFSWYCVQFIAWFAYQFCSLFKGVSDVIFNVNLWVEFLLFRRLFDSFSESRLRYFEFAINWHFKLIFTMCSTKQRWRSDRAHSCRPTKYQKFVWLTSTVHRKDHDQQSSGHTKFDVHFLCFLLAPCQVKLWEVASEAVI